MAADRIQRRLAAILAADVPGYASDLVRGGPTPYPLWSMLGGWFMLRLFAAIIVALGASGVADAGPLFEAAGRGDLAVVEKLLGEGVEVDQRARNAETPLIAAALAGETATAEVLIVHGADIMAHNKGGLTPLHAAAYSGSVEVARLLLDHGADLEDRDNVSGATPLIVAAEENRVVVAELLIARGADLSITDRDGFTALTQAWAKMRTEMVRLLKRHGATCQPVEILGTDDYYRRCVEAGE
jgi:ankyrin repeat protein